jgi:flavin-dependent dehydrogenase
MLAIQVCLAAPGPPAVHQVLFASGLTDFYGWAIPKGRAALVGAAFGRLGGARRRFEQILAALRRLASLQGPVLQRSGRRLSRPRSGRDLFGGAGRVLLAGEAAGLVSPSSGEGLSFALASGAAAGRAVGQADPAAAYGPAFGRQARRVRRKLLKARAIFSPKVRRLALRVPWCP